MSFVPKFTGTDPLAHIDCDTYPAFIEFICSYSEPIFDMHGEKMQVSFNAPESLVERADDISKLLGISRTKLLRRALRNEMEVIAEDEQFRRDLREGYYRGDGDFDTVRSVLRCPAPTTRNWPTSSCATLHPRNWTR